MLEPEAVRLYVCSLTIPTWPVIPTCDRLIGLFV